MFFSAKIAIITIGIYQLLVFFQKKKLIKYNMIQPFNRSEPLPHFPLMYIEMTDYIPNNIPVDGVFGLDIISQHKKIVIDFKNRYFQIK